MKLLILIFLISLSYVLSDVIDGKGKKIVKKFAKTVKHGPIQINKYVKQKTLATKKDKNDYTLFPKIGERANVPDSPYFQEAKNIDVKPRIKKVLEPRRKRSVDVDVDDQSRKGGKPPPHRPPKPINKPPKPVKKPDKGKRSVDVDDQSRKGGKPPPHRPPKPINKPPKPVKKPDKGKRSVDVDDQSRKGGKPPPHHPPKPINKPTKPVKKPDKGKRSVDDQSRKGGKPGGGGGYRPPKPINKPSKPVKKPHKNSRQGRTGRLRNSRNRYRNLRNSRSQRLRTRFAKRNAKMNRNYTNSMTNKVGRRLIAARDAMIEDYPYVVSIQKGKEHWCAGALLNPRLVITTANCLWKGNRVSRMSVRAGSRHTDRGGQVAYIKEILKHPGWKIRKAPDNDIAMVLLDRNIKFSNGVHSVDLPNRVMMPPFEDAWVTSWGSERRDGLFEVKSDTLQVYHARVIDRQKCNNVTSRFGVRVSDNFICMAQTGRRAPCTRDTGAPAVSDGVLWGLASWGIRKLCGTERFPAMFSYLASQTNLNFIINATVYLMSDEVHYPYLDRIQIQKQRRAT